MPLTITCGTSEGKLTIEMTLQHRPGLVWRGDPCTTYCTKSTLFSSTSPPKRNVLRVLHKGQRVTPSDTPINSVRIRIHVVIYGTLAQLYDMYTTVLVMHHEKTGRVRITIHVVLYGYVLFEACLRAPKGLIFQYVFPLRHIPLFPSRHVPFKACPLLLLVGLRKENWR